MLRLVSGDATPEEVAAIVAVLSAAGGVPSPGRGPAPAWSAHHRRVRAALPHGPGGWRASSMPR